MHMQNFLSRSPYVKMLHKRELFPVKNKQKSKYVKSSFSFPEV